MSQTERRTRIEVLTPEERAQMKPWAERWIATGLSTSRADRPAFEAAARECYRFAGLKPPKAIVWVDSPLVLALAAPMAAYILAMRRGGNVGNAVQDAVRGAMADAAAGWVLGAVTEEVESAVRGAVGFKAAEAVKSPAGALGVVYDAVENAVHDSAGLAVTNAVQDAVWDKVTDAARDWVLGAVTAEMEGAVRGAMGTIHDSVESAVHDSVGAAVTNVVQGALRGAMAGEVLGAVTEEVESAVRGAVGFKAAEAVIYGINVAPAEAVRDAVDSAVLDAVIKAVKNLWHRYLGGQFWVGGWWGPAWLSFFREVCHLDLPGDLWDRARAHEQTMQSACWWWPHKDFIMVCERPTVISTELVDSAQSPGWGSHRLHREDGPAIEWPDGWGVYSWHGVRVDPWVINTPAADLTPSMIHAEPNAEVRRVLIARMGMARYLTESNAKPIQADDYGQLYEIPVDNDRTMRVVRVINGTPEPDGERADCEMGDDGEWYKVYWLRVPSRMTTARQAVAWTNWHEDPSTYEEVIRT